MVILGIETSCDETAISIIDIDEKGDTVQILGNTVLSQMELHAPYGGVFPVLAKREHQKNLVPVLIQTLKQANLLEQKQKSQHSNILQNVRMILKMESELLKQFEKVMTTIEKPPIDLISVTAGPGLEPALWVGINFARALGTLWDIPIVPANHMEGHILVSLLSQKRDEEISNDKFLISKSENQIPDTRYNIHKFQCPALALLISGGHTEFIQIDKIGSYKKIGETRDDAVGECFDKIARTLGLPYPGGPQIGKLAKIAREEKIKLEIELPRPMIHTQDIDFSFSGLKTSVLYFVREHVLDEKLVKAVCREAEDAITDVIVSKTKRAIEEIGAQTLVVGGGVIANEYIRGALTKLAERMNVEILLPHIDHSTDNALMIALAGYFEQHKSEKAEIKITAQGNFSL